MSLGVWMLTLNTKCDECGWPMLDMNWEIIDHGGFVITRPSAEEIQGTSTAVKCPRCGYESNVEISELLQT